MARVSLTPSGFATILVGGVIGSGLEVAIDVYGDRIGLDTAEKKLAASLLIGIASIVIAGVIFFIVGKYQTAGAFLLVLGIPMTFVSLFYYLATRPGSSPSESPSSSPSSSPVTPPRREQIWVEA